MLERYLSIIFSMTSLDLFGKKKYDIGSSYIQYYRHKTEELDWQITICDI